MQRIFHFELGMAFKDRPKIFQVITLVLFAFSLTMILLGAVVRLASPGSSHQVHQQNQVDSYASIASSLSSAELIQK